MFTRKIDTDAVLRNLPIPRTQPDRRDFIVPMVGAGVAGAILAIMLDPTHGNRRRKLLAQRTAGTIRRGLRRAGRQGRYAVSTAEGKVQRLQNTAAINRPEELSVP